MTLPERHSTLLRLDIRRYRGIETLAWHPGSGVNLILGGGDVGKSTILAAIELLLLPSNAVSLSDSDYYGGRLDDGFEIEAVMLLPSETHVNQQSKMAWPWVWDGQNAVLPSNAGDEDAGDGVGCYRLRVSGSPELDLLHEIVQPDGTTTNLPVSLRRSIGLVHLDSQDSNDRDLRLLRGSALDRLLSYPALRSRLASKLAQVDVGEELRTEGKDALEVLDAAFREEGLPSGLDIGLTGARGLTVTALMGLTAKRGASRLPLTSWGAGTRRLASLTVARSHQTEHPVIIVDEVERGLEPYRQRSLMDALQRDESQSFVTTHSPAVLASASEARVWHMDRSGNVGDLDGKVVQRHRSRDPETFLARLAIVAEGATEVGFVTEILTKALNTGLETHGIHVTDGGGNDDVRALLSALRKAGFAFGGFADNEGDHADAWQSLREDNPLVFQWRTGCLEENVVSSVPRERLADIVEDPEGQLTGMRLRSLADRVGAEERTFEVICEKAGERIAQVVIDAATGRPPQGSDPRTQKMCKGQAQSWFKNEQGGKELAQKMFEFGAWEKLEDQLLPFVNAVLQEVGVPLAGNLT